MFLLPYADESLVATALDSPVSWDHAGTDRFLSSLSLECGAEYEGESDFGTLTRLDLDDELRVVCVLLDMLDQERFDEISLSNLISHYRAGVALGSGNDQKWWADWYLYPTDRASEIWSKFVDEYSAWLGDDDSA